MQQILEIVLITYNRATDLERTLSTILAADSPVKDLSITVLDNHSTDDTPHIISRFSQKHPNLHHVRHTRNIGSNANIARAFEIATAPYVWILCDDDDFHWSFWPEVQQAIQDDADAIVVNTEYTQGNTEIDKLYRLVTFLPSCIYKTSILNDNVMLTMYANISTWFPHLAAMAQVLNTKGKIAVTSGNIVTAGKKNGKINLGKKENMDNKTLPVIISLLEDIPAKARCQSIELGYYQACEMLSDPQTRAKAVENCIVGVPFWQTIRKVIRNNWKMNNGYLGNLLPVYSVFNTKQKFISMGCFLFQLLSVPKYYCSYLKHKRHLDRYKKHFGLKK